MEIATDINGDIKQPDEPLEGAAEVVDEMDPSQAYAAIDAADASWMERSMYESDIIIRIKQ